MKRINGCILFFILILLFFVFVPLLMPLPPLEGIKPLDELVYPESQFLEINDLDVHYQEIQNDGDLLVLLHGFGSSTYSWSKVMEPLSKYGSVIAYDRPGFGLTERLIPKKEIDYNPYSLSYQPVILNEFINSRDADQVFLVGNSAGGTVAILTALDFPETVQGLILISPAVYGGGGAPKFIKPLLNLPQINRLGPIFVRTIRERGLEILKLAWSNPEKITDTDIENYQKPLSVDRWDQGLWEFTKVNGDNNLETRLQELKMPVLIITGADDKIIPVDQSVRLSSDIPGSKLVIIPQCGHVPQEECPEEFLEAINTFFEENDFLD